MGFGPLTDPLTVVAVCGVRPSKRTDLGQFDTAGLGQPDLVAFERFDPASPSDFRTASPEPARIMMVRQRPAIAMSPALFLTPPPAGPESWTPAAPGEAAKFN
jgi:hypothetical protein